MRLYTNEKIKNLSRMVISAAGSNNPENIASYLGITIIEMPFKKQLGIFKVVLRNKYIFIKADLNETMRRIILFHEIGHSLMHASSFTQFFETEFFGAAVSMQEKEANLFAACALLNEKEAEVIRLFSEGFTIAETASMLDCPLLLMTLYANAFIKDRYVHELPRKIY